MSPYIMWCMLVAHDIVLVDEIARGANTKLEAWSGALESKGFGINRSKTRYMEYEFILVVVKVLELIE